MKELYECDWCNALFWVRDGCVKHESHCHKNPETKSCETCEHHDTVVAGTGKVWNTCAIGILESSKWVENHATKCPKWSLMK